MKTTLLVLLFLLAGWSGTAVVREKDPLRQALTSGFFGLVLAVLFLALQAPDVAISQVGVGAVLVPVLVVLSLAKIEENRWRRKRDGGDRKGDAKRREPEEASR